MTQQKAAGTEAEIDASFEKAYQILRKRIEAFLVLPISTLQHDKAQFKTALDNIGKH